MTEAASSAGVGPKAPMMKAPFPWFGGKSRAAPIIWRAFGDVRNYVEPFAGSLAVLLSRPTPPQIETVNDRDAYLANFWRALAADPDEVARWCDWPVNEADLHARHRWLVEQAGFRERMLTEPDFYDAKIAGWWVWGLCTWIGDGWCSGRNHQKLPLLENSGCGVHRADLSVREYLSEISARLRCVRIACGDWSRVTADSVTWRNGLTGVLLDPPYTEGAMDYAAGGTGTGLSAEVRAWAIEAGKRPDMRVALCGLEGEHEMPPEWRCVPWKARGAYGSQRKNDNRHRERIWLSPACLDTTIQRTLFDEVAA